MEIEALCDSCSQWNFLAGYGIVLSKRHKKRQTFRSLTFYLTGGILFNYFSGLLFNYFSGLLFNYYLQTTLKNPKFCV
jgi:hypothetical protein